jgi:phospho-N-acetylmuramoyl-pentapeptide-transferase
MPVLAFAIALLLVLLSGGAIIRLLAARCRETIRQDSARLQAIMSSKAETPTMGGLLILLGFLAGTLLFADWMDPHVAGAIALAVGLGAVGMWDDLAKRNVRRRGLSAKTKLAAQMIVVGAIVLAFPAAAIDRHPAVAIAAMLLVVGMSNAVNLTDGLDGLAAGCSLIVLAAMGLAASLWQSSGSSLAMIASLAGAVLGFLCFNRHPAKVFMGDTGSLALGGLLGWFVLALECPALLIACGVFFIEAASVVLQVGCFKCTGRRVLLCAPLHHHFQFLDWPERRIVHSFWLAALVCAMLGAGILQATSQP